MESGREEGMRENTPVEMAMNCAVCESERASVIINAWLGKDIRCIHILRANENGKFATLAMMMILHKNVARALKTCFKHLFTRLCVCEYKSYGQHTFRSQSSAGALELFATKTSSTTI